MFNTIQIFWVEWPSFNGISSRLGVHAQGNVGATEQEDHDVTRQLANERERQPEDSWTAGSSGTRYTLIWT